MFLVMEVRSVSVGHEKDVWFPSEDARENFGLISLQITPSIRIKNFVSARDWKGWSVSPWPHKDRAGGLYTELLILWPKSCDITCFFWSSEFFVVGIIFKDMHKLLPDESHSFLDGYVLESVGIKLTWATYLKLSELSLYPYKNIKM